MVLEGTWQMYLNGSHGLQQHREGKGRAPQKHSGRAAAVEGQAEGVATEKGRICLSGSYRLGRGL